MAGQGTHNETLRLLSEVIGGYPMAIETQLDRRPIPVIADVPSPAPGLGFQEYAEAIAAAIRGASLLSLR
jgi:hypothetical protein